MKNILKSPITYIIILFIIAFGFRINLQNATSGIAESVTVKLGNISQVVSATGRVKSAESVRLAFEIGGKISRAYFKVGDKVKAGQILVSLDNADLLAQLQQYQAARASQQALLDQYRNGTRPEEIQIAQTSLSNAQTKATSDLNNWYGTAHNTVQDAWTKADDALNNQISALFSNGNSASPTLSFDVTDRSLGNDAQTKRYAATAGLANLKNATDNFPTDQVAIDQTLSNALLQLNIVRDSLTAMASAIDNAAGLSATTIAADKLAINTARANANTAITTITNLQQNISGQKITNANNIAAAEDNLRLKQAGYTRDQIAAQVAAIDQADANIAYQQARIGKTILRSPIDGTVTRQDANAGEIAPAGATLVEVMSAA
ncbi:MAG: biotin/lipoyl-binding protein, partial [Parcubacteria group bacterium]